MTTYTKCDVCQRYINFREEEYLIITSIEDEDLELHMCKDCRIKIFERRNIKSQKQDTSKNKAEAKQN